MSGNEIGEERSCNLVVGFDALMVMEWLYTVVMAFE